MSLYEALSVAYHAFVVIGVLGNVLYLFVVNRTSVNSSRIESLQADLSALVAKVESDMGEKIDRQAGRLSSLESAVGSIPTREDIVRVHERIDESTRTFSRLSGEFKGVENVLNLIHQKMLGGQP